MEIRPLNSRVIKLLVRSWDYDEDDPNILVTLLNIYKLIRQVVDGHITNYCTSCFKRRLRSLFVKHYAKFGIYNHIIS